MSGSKQKLGGGSAILMVLLPLLCCGGFAVIPLVAAYGATIAGVLRQNSTLIILGITGASAAVAILFATRKRRRGRV